MAPEVIAGRYRSERTLRAIVVHRPHQQPVLQECIPSLLSKADDQ
jgi:hypothetical protein